MSVDLLTPPPAPRAGPPPVEGSAHYPSVLIHLTPAAPGLDGTLPDHQGRTREFHWVATLAVMRATLTRLQRAPHDVRAVTHIGGDVDLVAVEDPHAGLPLALIWDGLTAAEANRCLAELVKAGWKPRPTQPRNQGGAS